MSNRKNTRKENLNKYADMLHRQNVSGEKPKADEEKITKPFEEEKEIKMEKEVKTNEEIQEELSTSILQECYSLIREKIWDNLSDEQKAVITEDYSEEAAAAVRIYMFNLPKNELQEFTSNIIKTVVNSHMFDVTSDLLDKAEAEQAKNGEEKVDLMEEAKKAILEKAEEIEEKAFAENQEVKAESEEPVKETESKESVESSTESETVIVEAEEESSKSKEFVWPMDKLGEMFPDKVEEKTDSN